MEICMTKIWMAGRMMLQALDGQRFRMDFLHTLFALCLLLKLLYFTPAKGKLFIVLELPLPHIPAQGICWLP